MDPNSYCRCDSNIALVCPWCSAQANQAQARKDREERAAPVPPHAAGEQATIAIRGDHLKDIATQGATLTVSVNDGTIQQSCNLAGCDGRCGICSPAASQAAPEMPEWVRDNIGIARSTCEDEARDNTHDTIVWLADRLEAMLAKKP